MPVCVATDLHGRCSSPLGPALRPLLLPSDIHALTIHYQPQHSLLRLHPTLAGKSHLTGLLPASLAASHQLRIATLSLDDLYLTHQDQLKLADSHPTNKLLHGRGQPGTHDLPLAQSILAQLHAANDPSNAGRPIALPVYDKSRFGGQGDRSDETVQVEGPFDLVIFEGWMNGFYHLAPHKLTERWLEAKDDPVRWASEHLDYPAPAFFLSHKKEDVLEANDLLKQYVHKIWKYIGCFVQLAPVDMSYVWKWRLQVSAKPGERGSGSGWHRQA